MKYQFGINLESVTEKSMYMAYNELIGNGITELEAWQAVHRICPDKALPQLMLAMMNLGWREAARFVIQLTESPAFLFTQLGDGASFNECIHSASFASRESAVVFSERFPGWLVYVAEAVA